MVNRDDAATVDFLRDALLEVIEHLEAGEYGEAIEVAERAWEGTRGT